MFTDNKIASQFSVGKTKYSYSINYGPTIYFKDGLRKQISIPHFLSLSFDDSLNVEMQDC